MPTSFASRVTRSSIHNLSIPYYIVYTSDMVYLDMCRSYLLRLYNMILHFHPFDAIHV